MGNRLTKIYTRTGDDGTTGLATGPRVDKDSPRIEAIGAIDELNSVVGVLLAGELPADIADMLRAIQHRLFDLGGELAMPGEQILGAGDVESLERSLDGLNAALPPLREFVLPGGGPGGASAHLARAVCRRAERRLLTLSRSETVNPVSLAWLNRLSDLLFVLARSLASTAGIPETLWQPAGRPGSS